MTERRPLHSGEAGAFLPVNDFRTAAVQILAEQV